MDLAHEPPHRRRVQRSAMRGRCGCCGRVLARLLACAACACGPLDAVANDGAGVPLPRAAASSAEPATASAGFDVVPWDALLPGDGSAGRPGGSALLAFMGDDDPRAKAALEALRQSYRRAPASPAMDGRRIRIAGFVVPLDAVAGQGLRELLLVPYYGACIHAPPPPPSQVIRVALDGPARELNLMDRVWLSGVLRVEASDTDMGPAGYRMETPRVERISSGVAGSDAQARLWQAMPILVGGVAPLVLAGLLLAWHVRRSEGPSRRPRGRGRRSARLAVGPRGRSAR